MSLLSCCDGRSRVKRCASQTASWIVLRRVDWQISHGEERQLSCQKNSTGGTATTFSGYLLRVEDNGLTLARLSSMAVPQAIVLHLHGCVE